MYFLMLSLRERTLCMLPKPLTWTATACKYTPLCLSVAQYPLLIYLISKQLHWIKKDVFIVVIDQKLFYFERVRVCNQIHHGFYIDAANFLYRNCCGVHTIANYNHTVWHVCINPVHVAFLTILLRHQQWQNNFCFLVWLLQIRQVSITCKNMFKKSARVRQ